LSSDEQEPQADVDVTGIGANRPGHRDERWLLEGFSEYRSDTELFACLAARRVDWMLARLDMSTSW
jgi:hypothetical protein